MDMKYSTAITNKALESSLRRGHVEYQDGMEKSIKNLNMRFGMGVTAEWIVQWSKG